MSIGIGTKKRYRLSYFNFIQWSIELYFNEKKNAGSDVMTALDELGFDLYCCRRMFVSHIDLISEVAPFSAPRERA